jgi:release factor glutamine methyltransferase
MLPTVDQIRRTLRSRLEPKFGTNEARALERIIFEDVMNLRPIDVAVSPERELPEFIPAKVDAIIERLLADEPIQQVLGTARFCGMMLRVTPNVLIPRPETEQLVDMIADRWRNVPDVRVLDIGTGSGCIAIALARALRFPQVTAVDISADALNVARRNAAEWKVAIDLQQADALQLQLPGEWDVIVSNPPYIMQSEAAEMEPRVLRHEPHTALFVPDAEPMLFYDAIRAYAARHLSARGMLYFEINPLMAQRYRGADIVKDFCGRDRFAIYETKEAIN